MGSMEAVWWNFGEAESKLRPTWSQVATKMGYDRAKLGVYGARMTISESTWQLVVFLGAQIGGIWSQDGGQERQYRPT